MTVTDAQRLDAIAGLSCELLAALQPWALHRPEVRSAATRLTVALAAIPNAGLDPEVTTPADGMSA